MNIIVVQTAFLGDVLLSLPLCKLANENLHASVTLVTTPQAAAMVSGVPYLHDVVAYDKRGRHSSILATRRLAKALSHKADIVIVPHESLRTAILVHAMQARRTITYSSALTRFIADDIVPKPTSGHDADKQLALLNVLLPNPVTKEAAWPLELPRNHGENGTPFVNLPDRYVVVAPGSVWPTKQWPREHVRELSYELAEFGLDVVAIGDSSTMGWVGDHSKIHDLCGRTTLIQAAEIIGKALVVVSNDSSPMHMASLQNVPTVALFGPTIPEFGFGPYAERSVILEQQLPCRPCSAHGTVKCPIGTHECLVTLAPSTVCTAVTAML